MVKNKKIKVATCIIKHVQQLSILKAATINIFILTVDYVSTLM